MSEIPSRRVSSPFFIGLFVIVGFFLTIAVIVWLGASQIFRDNVYYVTYFDASVEGLETGSAVKYLGVPVGTINKIEVAPDGRLVQITMRIDTKIEITDSLRVKAEFAGIAGGKFLQLHFPSQPEAYYMHPKLRFQVPFTVIPSAPSGFEEIEVAARAVVDNLMQFQAGEISRGAVAFFDATAKFFENEEMYNMVTELKAASMRLNSIMASLDTSKIISNFEYSSEQIVNAANNLNYMTHSLNAKIDNIDIDGTLAHALASYDSLLVNIQLTVGSLGYQSSAVLVGLNETIENIKRTNKDLRKSLRSLTDNPSQIFLTEPPPPEK